LIGHAFFAMIIVYGILAVVGEPRRAKTPARVATTRRDDDALDERLDAHRRRMREIDTFVAGSNSRLAREIESLRQD
jgi:hypothetical protein